MRLLFAVDRRVGSWQPQAVSVLPELRYERFGQEQCSRLNPLSAAVIVYFSYCLQQILFN